MTLYDLYDSWFQFALLFCENGNKGETEACLCRSMNKWLMNLEMMTGGPVLHLWVPRKQGRFANCNVGAAALGEVSYIAKCSYQLTNLHMLSSKHGIGFEQIPSESCNPKWPFK